MDVPRRLAALLILSMAWVLAAGQCTGTVTGPDLGVDPTPDATTPPDAARDTGGDDPGDTSDKTIQSLALQPSTATLTSSNGSKPTEDFDLMVTYADGSTGPPPATVEFTTADRRVGTVASDTGTFTASGRTGGQTTVEASIPSRPDLGSASATVTVQLTHTIEAANLPSDYKSKFASPSSRADQAAGIVYPLDGAIMPQNVYPADIQWSRGQQGDLFRVRLTKSNIEVTAYMAHSGSGFGNHWLVDQAPWRALARTDPDEPATIEVTRYVAASDTAVAPQKTPAIEFAKGSLTGSVYYWDISATRIKRIDDGSGKAVSFMPDPPNSQNDGQNCVGCHTVSNSGRYMVGRLGPGDNIGGVFDLTKDLSQKPVPSEFAIEDDGTRWWFSTWNPDDTRLMVTQGPGSNQRLSLMDPFTGQIIEPKEGSLPQSGATHPAWAPDDSLVAYVTNGNRWGGELDQGDIATLPVTGDDRFGQPQTILKARDIQSNDPEGDTASYPTWSPDSQWIAFAHGSGARSVDDTSALYLMKRDGSNVVRLDDANGGPMTDDTFQPNFSPFETEDYFWLSFLSKRAYGNESVGTRDAPHQQIWVSAIAKDPQPGKDPSRPAYWLPGQSTDSSNISAFWAPRACRDNGKSCTVGSECCSGECVEDAEGNLTCSPPETMCRNVGETCSSDADCCETSFAVECVGRVCAPTGG